MSEQTRNDDMERDARLTALYRAAAQDRPPPQLDDALRAAARRAVASKPQSASSLFSRSWRVPLSIAAVLVLSVSLVTLMREEAPEITQPPGVELSSPESAPSRQRAATSPMAEEPSLAVPKAAAPDQKSSGLGLKPSSSGEGLRRDQDSVASVTQLKKETAASEPTGNLRSAPAKQVLPEAFPGATERRGSNQAVEQPRQKVSEPARDTVTAERQRPSMAPAAPAPKIQAPSVPESARDMSAAERQRPATAPGAPAEPKIQAQTEGDSARRESELARAQPPVAVMKSAPLPAAKPAPRPALGATAADGSAPPTSSAAVQPYTNQPPEKWLEQIAELRKQGRLEEARASFADFRRRYPDYPLPPAFKEWAKP